MGHVRAKEAFAYTDHNGIPRVVRPGAIFTDDDPAVTKRAHLFEPIEAGIERRQPTVEDATAEPGAKRSVSTKGAAKSAPAPAEPASAPAPADNDASGSNQG
ncbi:hypothetical protein A3N99_02805 [Mycobacteroides abscessus]|uniref:hypothetical protein n=1 Tax=Mycobacteroides abscessus TaxID=36809 RepID=UPI00078D3C6C|nr:hypothetical protein [Mycobacteroides abscessus]AMU39237.1 hypothetical protein A3N99_02805 [Mycobacteroides abscessus]